jgi:hypothetical protein
LTCACLLLLGLQVSYLRGIFPEDHYKTVDMRNLDSERRRLRAGGAPPAVADASARCCLSRLLCPSSPLPPIPAPLQTCPSAC